MDFEKFMFHFMCYVVEYSLQSFYESMHAVGIKKTIKFWLVGGIWGGWLGGC